MDTEYVEGLESIVGRVERTLDRAMHERQAMGLHVPKDFTLVVQYFGIENARACATYNDDGLPELCVNALGFMSEDTRGDVVQAVSFLAQYFSVATSVFGGYVYENNIIALMEHPILTLRQFEEECPNIVVQNEEMGRLRGNPYAQQKGFLIRNAKSAREAMALVQPHIPRLFGKHLLNTLRHELDHLDFFGSALYREYSAVRDAWFDLVCSEEPAGGEPVYDACLDYLGAMSQTLSLVEARGMFFIFVPMGKFDAEHVARARRQVDMTLAFDYPDGAYVHEAMQKLASAFAIHGNMDQTTFNFLEYAAFRRSHSNGVANYSVEKADIDARSFAEIYYEWLPKWQMGFAQHAFRASEAIACALLEDPRRFIAAHEMPSFDEYIAVLKAE